MTSTLRPLYSSIDDWFISAILNFFFNVFDGLLLVSGLVFFGQGIITFKDQEVGLSNALYYTICCSVSAIIIRGHLAPPQIPIESQLISLWVERCWYLRQPWSSNRVSQIYSGTDILIDF